MAFLKYARATVVKPSISMAEWEHDVRAKAQALGTAFDKQGASRKVLQKYDPNKYLLSHCTIIASVDVELAGAKLGRQMVDGFQIDRRYNDYLVTPETSQYINNNQDCWERKLLLASFRTFVGGENYVEHLQIPELSKGKIIDAAARDIGDSIYVDILVATDRKHKPLIAAVQSGELQTLSMGCQVAFTICTKCGNMAEDETQLCPHIRFMKGNTFIDSLGKRRKIAELCGHIQAEPGSVKFIEASWVAHPAFTGAVLRSILTPEQVVSLGNRLQFAFNQAPRVADAGTMQRAASRPKVSQFDFGEGGGESGSESGGEAPAAPGEEAPKGPDPLEQAIGDMADFIREKAIGKIRQQMGDKEVPRADMAENQNNTLIKEASRNPYWQRVSKVVLEKVGSREQTRRLLFGLLLYRRGGWRAIQASGRFKGTDFLALSRLLDAFNQTPRIAGEGRLYRTVVAVGGAAVYADVKSYLAACRRVMGRDLTGSEEDTLVVKGRLYDLGAFSRLTGPS
jgi:hypothetical protein